MLFATVRTTPDIGSQTWARFLAKSVDGLLVGLLSVAPAFLAPDWAVSWRDIIDSFGWLGALILGQLVYAGLFMSLDVALLPIFGTTPGRALLGLKVVQPKTGGNPTLLRALWRTEQLWTIGMGLGIPFISQFTMIIAWTDLQKTGSTSWDRSSGLQIQQTVVHSTRWWLAMGIFVFLIAFRAFTTMVSGAAPI